MYSIILRYAAFIDRRFGPFIRSQTWATRITTALAMVWLTFLGVMALALRPDFGEFLRGFLIFGLLPLFAIWVILYLILGDRKQAPPESIDEWRDRHGL